MRRGRSRDQWWRKLSDGKTREKHPAVDPMIGRASNQVASSQPQPHASIVTDAIGDQARAEQNFHNTQVQSGWEIIRENKPIETAAELANVQLARADAGMFPEPVSEPVQNPRPVDPMAPMPGGFQGPEKPGS